MRWAGALALALAGCGDCSPPPPPPPDEFEDRELAAQVFEEGEPPEPGEPPPAISDLAVEPWGRRSSPPAPVALVHEDREHADEQPVRARRYVFRVRMVVPAGLGHGSDRIALPSAELFVDVSQDRLRARFAGPGWPVHAGSEIRLRRDRPGVYVFDGGGGRPLEPGELAAWFEGGRVTRRGPPLRVLWRYGRRVAPEPSEDEAIPGELVCALLAEWAGEPRDNVMRRCDRGAPYFWRLGFWRAEQTAGLPVELPRAALRADHVGAPAPVAAHDARAFLEPAALQRIEPSEPAVAPAEGAPAEGLRVSNESATRVIVTVQGVAIGWVDAGSSALFVGLAPGVYDVGTIRPLGAVVQRDRPVPVPGVHRVCDGRCRRPPPAR